MIYNYSCPLEFYKDGGRIYIKKKNRGKFTESAKRAGETVQQHATSVLNNPNATPLQKKRANFARNASKWNHKKYQEGGEFLFNIPLYKEEQNRIKQQREKRKDRMPDFSDIKTHDNKRGYDLNNVNTLYTKLKPYFINDTMPESEKISGYKKLSAIIGSAIEESGVNSLSRSSGKRYAGIFQWDKNERYPEFNKNENKDTLLNRQINKIIKEVVKAKNLDQNWTHGGENSGYQGYEDTYKEWNKGDAVKGLNFGYIRPHGKHNSVKNRRFVADQIFERIKWLKPPYKEAINKE